MNLNRLRRNHPVFYYLILILIIGCVKGTLNSVFVSPLTINSIATYTWSINLSATPSSPLTLTFPTQVTILSNCSITVNGGPATFSRTSNAVVINSSIASSSLTVIVSNIQNPPSAISTFSFSYLIQGGTSQFLLLRNQVQYETGTLSSCPWSFSQCTEQSNSDLLVSFTTANRLTSGNNYFLIGYSSLWPNHQSKGLVTGVTSVTCSYSVNSSTFTPATPCTIDGTNNQIVFLFTSGDIGAGTSIVVKVSGVIAPPTKTVTTSSNYFIFTADSDQNKIDGLSGCSFNSLCVTNLTNGAFTNSITNVNDNIGNLALVFTTALTITIQPSDTIEVYYSPFSSLMSCTTFKFYRSATPFYSISSPSTGSNFISFTYPSSQSANTQYGSPFNLFLDCTSFLLPSSQTTTNLSFIWKRNSLQILHLNATVAATASTFNSSRASLSLSSTSMNAASTFTLNFLLGQALGNNPAIKITLPTDFTIGTPICSASALGITVSSATCSLDSNTVTIVITTSSQTIPKNSNTTLTIQGITNPSFPKTYFFPLNTYYDSAISTSKVETSLTAFTTTITQISNYPVTLTPTGLTVFSQANIILTFTSTIPIPSFTTFYIQFPAGVSSISPNTNLFAIGGSPQAINGTVNTNTSGNSVTFVSGSAVAVGDIVSITIPLKTPSNIATYSFVKLIVTNNSTSYLSSKNTLFLNVNSVSSMGMQIAPLTSIAGSISSYSLTLFLTIPHANSFIVQVDVPSDTSFITSSATCTNCLSSVTPKNATSLQFTANNLLATAATSITFILSSFVNPRNIGSSLAWGVSTKTVSPSNLISYQTGSATISSPNTLTAVLSISESYYRNNTSPVKMTFKFTNSLASGDFIQLSATNDVYSAISSTSVTCSNIYGSCSLVSNSNVTVVKITPNVGSIINNTLFVIVQGLISGSSSSYSFTYNIGVTTMTSNSSLMDSGTMVYNVSCSQNSTNSCRRCYNNGSCIDCYLSIGYYLYGNKCVTLCGSASGFVSYASNSSGTCVVCINNCETCESETYCRSCITNYYLYPDNTCRISCTTSLGYYVGGTSSDLKCYTCIPNCLECVNGSTSCTRCDSQTLLISGSCLGGCGSTNYYQLNGQCILCDNSCFNCSGPGPGSCYTCSSNYHRYTTLCVNPCPNGTAINPTTGDCGCDSKCLTCSTYAACTACLNSSFWVMNGACISECPTGTYASLGQCITCSTGCQNCTINSCVSCVGGNYLFNNSCYSDCNLISLQYDNSGITCILCPSGCDRCTATTCNSCLSDYTMSNSQCIKTCLLDNSCDTTTQVLPLPGFIALGIWIGISIIIHFVYHKNYLPYSIILLSGIIQFVLLVGLLGSLGSTTSRLLAASTEYVGQMRGLLAAGIALNYLQNITYIILFIYYIKPLITNPRQIDIISNVTVLVIALLTNFRFGLIAFSRMFPKPNIYVQNASKLTPIHYLCIVSMFLDVITLVGCGVGLLNAKKLSNTFMLSIDLLILILVNYAVTICFVSTSKPETYYDEFVKKYHIKEDINQTDQTLANEKNVSKAKMTGHESFNFDQFEHTQNEDGSYKKLNREQDKLRNHSNNQSTSYLKENVYPVTIQPKTNDLGDPDPFMDPNFETNLKSKKSGRAKDSMISSKVDFNKSFDQSGKSMDDNLSTKKNNRISNNLSKEVLKSERKKIEPQKNIVEVSQSDYPDLEQDSNKQPSNVFNAKKQKLNKPKRSKQIKPTNKTVDDPLKIMKKGDKIGYFQSDAYDSNIDGEDLQEIIKQKIWQSASKIQKRSMQSFKDSNQQTGQEQISPSWFNIQNQRLDITDLQQSDHQQ